MRFTDPNWHPRKIRLDAQGGQRFEFIRMVDGEGFEPSKAEPSDLQSDPFDHSGTRPYSLDFLKEKLINRK